jgi:hypothetical protein
MKRIIFVGLVLAFLLAACGSAASAPAATKLPDLTATLAVTDVIAATEPAAQADNTSVPVAQAEVARPTLPPPPPPQNPNPLPDALFVNPTRSRDAFALKCSSSEITFGIKTTNPVVVSVDFYYRLQDKSAQPNSGTWRNGAQMHGDGQGNFSLIFAANGINVDSRFSQGWFDYQFVGLNKYGDVIGRSDRFVQQVTFTIDCP